ncbi:hypothetical protein, partial [Vibrio paucivorans]
MKYYVSFMFFFGLAITSLWASANHNIYDKSKIPEGEVLIYDLQFESPPLSGEKARLTYGYYSESPHGSATYNWYIDNEHNGGWFVEEINESGGAFEFDIPSGTSGKTIFVELQAFSQNGHYSDSTIISGVIDNEAPVVLTSDLEFEAPPQENNVAILSYAYHSELA